MKARMKMNWKSGLAALLVLAGVSAVGHAAPSPSDPCDFKADMRKLWEDHVVWTRLYIIDATADLPSKDATTQRLLKNQVDIGDAVKPFYGDAAGEKLTKLLKEHILIAAELIDAAKMGKKAKQEDAAKRWQANADGIASFLSAANPQNWPESEMKKMMKEHLDTTTAEVTARLKKNWKEDVAAYDKVHETILEMADQLSSGIVKQFPEKFRGEKIKG